MKSKLDSVCGCRHPLNDGIMRVTDMVIGCAFALRVSGVRVFTNL